jgi:dTDP-4-dehydrorhamnose reductase
MIGDMVGPVLVTGGKGQVGGEIADRAAAHGVDVVAIDIDEMNLLDPASIAAMMASRDWQAVIHCAAYTAVDQAEQDVATAWGVNAVSPAILAYETAKRGIPIVQVSTDYVFDGASATPYRPDDYAAPLGVYGGSKLAGEIAVRSGNPRHAVLRTAWVVSSRGNNFVKTMRRFGRERDVMRVVADQHGCPTSAADIAETLLTITKHMLAPDAPSGTWHFVNAGDATWHDLAEAVFVDLEQREGKRPVLEAITTAEYPTPARRPAYSRLDTSTLTRDFGIVPRPWRQAVGDILEALARIDASPVDGGRGGI